MHDRKMSSAIEGDVPLPPLTALRAFEAAARHGSFTLAARELAVTQTAVSHQVRQLEEHLATALFRRMPRRIELTADGRAWAEALEDVFMRLYAANKRLRARPVRARPVVSVSVLPSFASRWLVPRLGRFFEKHPDIDVRISPSAELVDFAGEDIDVGIRYGTGKYPGLRVEKLCEDAWLVVCAPGLPLRKKLTRVSDLSRVPIIEDDQREALEAWLAAHGAAPHPRTRAMMYTDSSMVVEAAVRGQGVAIVRLAIASDELAAGRIVPVFPRVKPLSTGSAYYMAQRRTPSPRPEVALFCAFMREEIAAWKREAPPLR
jgi:LysR family glycine cleavage system transcriptional activator